MVTETILGSFVRMRNLIHMSTSLHTVTLCLTKLHNVTCCKTATVASPEGNTSLVSIEVYDTKWSTISSACSMQITAAHQDKVTDVVSVHRVAWAINVVALCQGLNKFNFKM